MSKALTHLTSPKNLLAIGLLVGVNHHAEAGAILQTMDLTQHWVGFFALAVFFGAYGLVIL